MICLLKRKRQCATNLTQKRYLEEPLASLAEGTSSHHEKAKQQQSWSIDIDEMENSTEMCCKEGKLEMEDGS
jgi:hypothetical protein